MPAARFSTVPEWNYGPTEDHVRRMCQAINGILVGQANNHYYVDLDASTTTTTIQDLDCNVDSVVILSPMSATAAAAFGAGLVWATPSAGLITITHNSAFVIDRKFGVLRNG
tara:strand:+ start:1433 stop:1768 length:336 start_codon:yes stop_codon:yes gene_type:complete